MKYQLLTILLLTTCALTAHVTITPPSESALSSTAPLNSIAPKEFTNWLASHRKRLSAEDKFHHSEFAIYGAKGKAADALDKIWANTELKECDRIPEMNKALLKFHKEEMAARKVTGKNNRARGEMNRACEKAREALNQKVNAVKRLRRRLHPEPVGENARAAWEEAFKAEEAHLAKQRIFHTSELQRYKNRDEQYAAEEAAWNNASIDFKQRFTNVKDAHKKYRDIERGLNKTINANKRARNPFKQKRIQTFRKAMRTKGRRLEAVDDAFKAYMDDAKLANDSEQAFHNVEFREFDERQKCVDQGREALKNPEADKHEFSKQYKDCIRNVVQSIKKAIVNVADKKRKVDRKDVGRKWNAFVKAAQQHMRKSKQRKLAEDNCDSELCTAFKTANKARHDHKDLEFVFHNSEFKRYEHASKCFDEIEALYNDGKTYKEVFDAQRKCMTEGRGERAGEIAKNNRARRDARKVVRDTVGKFNEVVKRVCYSKKNRRF